MENLERTIAKLEETRRVSVGDGHSLLAYLIEVALQQAQYELDQMKVKPVVGDSVQRRVTH